MHGATVGRQMALVFSAVLTLGFMHAPDVLSDAPTKEGAAGGKLTISDDPNASRHRDLEKIFADGESEKGLAIVEQRLRTEPNDPELYVHQFRFLFEIGERYNKDDAPFDKQAHYEKMLRILKRAFALAPDHPRLWWGKGIVTARLGTTRGVLASLRSATTIERAWKRVVERDYRYRSLDGTEILPCDAMLALGMFYRMVPDWWIVKIIAGTRGDLQKSLRLLERSETCAPDRIRSVKELGVTQLCLGEEDAKMRKRGLATLTRVGTLKKLRSIDHIDVRHAKWLRSHPDEACRYSRDGMMARDRSLLQ